MAMTKADFEAIAEAMAEAKRVIEYNREPGSDQYIAGMTALDIATRELATACARQYKGGMGFNRQRFVDACGFPEA